MSTAWRWYMRNAFIASINEITKFEGFNFIYSILKLTNELKLCIWNVSILLTRLIYCEQDAHTLIILHKH